MQRFGSYLSIFQPVIFAFKAYAGFTPQGPNDPHGLPLSLQATFMIFPREVKCPEFALKPTGANGEIHPASGEQVKCGPHLGQQAGTSEGGDQHHMAHTNLTGSPGQIGHGCPSLMNAVLLLALAIGRPKGIDHMVIASKEVVPHLFSPQCHLDIQLRRNRRHKET